MYNDENVPDIYNDLFKDRIIFIKGCIDENVSSEVVAKMLLLANEKPDTEIKLYINSDEGYIVPGLAIYDMIKFIPSDVATYCLGECSGVAAVVLAGGTKGKRYAFPNSTIALRGPSIESYGQATDIKIESDELLRKKEILINLLSCDSEIPDINEKMERTTYLAAKEAQQYKMVDIIL